MIVSYCVCEKCGRRGIAVEDIQDARCPSVGVLLAVCFECEDVEIRSGTPEQLTPGKEIRRRTPQDRVPVPEAEDDATSGYGTRVVLLSEPVGGEAEAYPLCICGAAFQPATMICPRHPERIQPR